MTLTFTLLYHFVNCFVPGEIDAEMLKQLTAKYFNGDQTSLVREMENMLPTHTYQKRKRQIEICTDLEQYHEGARVMLELKKEFELSGDFSDMEKIMASVIL